MPICIKCGKIQNQNPSKRTYFCKNCEGIICGNCSKSHYIDNPEHICNYINIEDKRYWIIPEKIKCSNCNELKPINVIYNCNICEGKPFCKNFSQSHNINNPNHILKLYGKSDEEHENSLNKLRNENEMDLQNCPNCGAKDILSKNNLNSCPTCKVVLCDKCQNNHYITNPSHSKPKDNSEINEYEKRILTDDKLIKKKIGEPNQKTDKNIPYRKINFTSNCKICNNSLPLGEEECIVVNCDDCDGNLCDECCDEHEKNYSQHKLNPIRALFIENITDINDSMPKLKCGNCRKNISDNENIYYCDECRIDLCNSCGDNHEKENPEHDLLLTKRILKNYNKGDISCRECGTNLGKNDDAFRKCDKCKIDLCDTCGDNHIKKYSNHNILYSLKYYYKPSNNNVDNRDFWNSLKIPNNKCNSCNRKINLKNNDIIYYCRNCNGNLCYNCNIAHNKNYPYHIKINPKAIILNKDIEINKLPIYQCISCDKKLKSNLNIPFINCDKCHGNLCNDCNDSHPKDFPNHNLQIVKYIIPDDNKDKEFLDKDIPISFECISCFEKIPLNSEIIYCNNCNGKICENCLISHNKNNKIHKIQQLNTILIKKTKNNIFNQPNIICNSCGADLNKDINYYISSCPKCKKILFF